MQPALLLLILTSVAMSACAQLLLKLGVGQAGADGAGIAFLQSPWVLAGFGLYGLGAILWLYVLARQPLSAAYPFVGLGFLFTLALGVLALDCVCVSRSIA